MMTSDKNFKMKSTTKTQMSLMRVSKESRNHFKRMMIDAQLCEESAQRAAMKSKDTGNSRGKHSKEGVALD